MFIRLFYSNKSQECTNLWQVIINENIAKIFIPICLDNYSSQQLSQLRIKEIPAIVISSDKQPSAIYEGPQQCSHWLTNFTINRRQNLVSHVEAQRKLIQRAQAIARQQDGGALEYIEAEMDGVTDGYAYNATDLCQPKNFITVGEEEKYNIITPQFNENKINAKDMQSQISQLETNRNNDNKKIMEQMEQNQIKAVINYNAGY